MGQTKTNPPHLKHHLMLVPRTPPSQPEPTLAIPRPPVMASLSQQPNLQTLLRQFQHRAAADLQRVNTALRAVNSIQAWWRRNRSPFVFRSNGKRLASVMSLDIVRDLEWKDLTRRLGSKYVLSLASRLLQAVRISLSQHGRNPDACNMRVKILLSAYVMVAERDSSDTIPKTATAEEDGTVAVPALLLLLSFEKLAVRPCCTALDAFVKAASDYQAAFSTWKTNDKEELTQMLLNKIKDVEATLVKVRSGCKKNSPSLKGMELFPEGSQQRNDVIAELNAERTRLVQQLIKFGGEEYCAMLTDSMEPLALDDTTPPKEPSSETPPDPAALPTSPKLHPAGIKESMAHDMMLEKLPENEVEQLQSQIAEQMKRAFWNQTEEVLSHAASSEADSTALRAAADCMAGLLSNLKDGLKEITPSRQDLHAHLDTILDAQLLHSQIQHNAIDPGQLIALIVAAAEHIKCLEAPAANEETSRFCEEVRVRFLSHANHDDDHAAMTGANVVYAFRFLLERVETIRKGVLSFVSTQAQPIITEHGATYVRSAFMRRMANSGMNPSQLITSKWLQRIAGGKTQDVLKVVADGIISLITAQGVIEDNDLPETLLLDSRRIHFLRVELQQLTIAATAVALASQALQSARAPTPSSDWFESFKNRTLLDLRDGQLTVNAIAERLASIIDKHIVDTHGHQNVAQQQAQRFQSVFASTVVAVFKGQQSDVACLIFNRLKDIVRKSVDNNGLPQDSEMARFPLNCMPEELSRITRLTAQLVLLNQAEHFPLYNQLLRSS